MGMTDQFVVTKTAIESVLAKLSDIKHNVATKLKIDVEQMGIESKNFNNKNFFYLAILKICKDFRLARPPRRSFLD